MREGWGKVGKDKMLGEDHVIDCLKNYEHISLHWAPAFDQRPYLEPPKQGYRNGDEKCTKALLDGDDDGDNKRFTSEK